MPKEFAPCFQTPMEELCKEELNKLHSNGLRDHLKEELNNLDKPDIIWEAEQIAKSYGIYLEYNRALTGSEKDWIYMIRISNPGGGPIDREQWLLLDELSEQYGIDPQGRTSLRLTTRQNIQFHWVRKNGVVPIVKTMAEHGLRSLNGCGDNTRNVMGCPLSRGSQVFDAHAWAHETALYFQLPLEPYMEIFAIDPNYIRKPGESYPYGPTLLNRKFKIAFSCWHQDHRNGRWYPDNCVEALTNDMAVVPVFERDRVDHFQIYVGGGQGERNGKPSSACLALPLGRVDRQRLMSALSAVVKVHETYGDRKNRFWARLKYLVRAKGVAWFRREVERQAGFKLEDPVDVPVGPRHLHFGWHRDVDGRRWHFGAFIENGRITDHSPNGRLKTMVREIVQKFPIELMVTPNQDLLFCNIPESAKEEFEAAIRSYGYGKRNNRPYSQLRLRSGACVGRDTCRLTYTDSEKFEPELLDRLEEMGWGEMKESIGITGCERQCFRPSTKTIGLVGSGLNRYQIRIMGDEAASSQGRPLISADGTKMYLRSVPREEVPAVIDALFRFYQANRQNDEDMGRFHRRVGLQAVIDFLKSDPATAALMAKTFPADTFLDPDAEQWMPSGV